MKMLELRNNNLLGIVAYLSPKDLITFELVCKHFQGFLNKYKEFIQKSCISYFGLEYASDLFHWKRIITEKLLDTNDFILIFAAFNAMDENSAGNNLSLTQSANTLNESNNAVQKNVLSKYTFFENLMLDVTSRLINIKLPMIVDYIKENEAEKFQKFCPYIKTISIKKFQTFGNMDPLLIYVFFSSLKFESLDLIQHFHSCESRESVLKAANQMNITEVKEAEDEENIKNREVIQFSRTSNSVQVLCWINMFDQSKSFTVNLYEGVFARYFYVLKISGGGVRSSFRIDHLNIRPHGSLVQIRENGID